MQFLIIQTLSLSQPRSPNSGLCSFVGRQQFPSRSSETISNLLAAVKVLFGFILEVHISLRFVLCSSTSLGFFLSFLLFSLSLRHNHCPRRLLHPFHTPRPSCSSLSGTSRQLQSLGAKLETLVGQGSAVSYRDWDLCEGTP